jgi:hypothetical protein
VQMLTVLLLVDLQDVVVDIHDCELDGNPVRPERLELEGGHRAKGVLDQYLIDGKVYLFPGNEITLCVRFRGSLMVSSSIIETGA